MKLILFVNLQNQKTNEPTNQPTPPNLQYSNSLLAGLGELRHHRRRLPNQILAEQTALEWWPMDGDWWQKMRMGLYTSCMYH